MWTTYRWRGAKSAKSNNDILVSAHPTARLANSLLSDSQTDWRTWASGPFLPAFRFFSVRCADFPRKGPSTSRAAYRRLIGSSWSTRNLRPAFLAIDRKNHRWRLALDRRGSSCPRCSLEREKGLCRDNPKRRRDDAWLLPIYAYLCPSRGIPKLNGDRWTMARLSSR